MGFYNAQVGGAQTGGYFTRPPAPMTEGNNLRLMAPAAAPPPPPPVPVAPPPPPSPAYAWPIPPTPTTPSGPTTPAPVTGPWTPPGFGATALLDLAKMVAHPIQTVKSLFLVVKDVFALQTKRGLSVATAAPAMATYEVARKNLEEAPFRKIFPFFEKAMDKWAYARVQELAPEIQQRLSQRAWHPITLEWPDGGKGHDMLTELMMVSNVADRATDGQVVNALVGANRLQFKNSTAMDYFYPMARAGDALILRRNLPLVPGQKSIAETFTAHMNKQIQVQIQI